MDRYFKNNESLWDSRVETHLKSALYDMEAFKKGKNSLNSIELEQIADKVAGKKLLHLQCHFGQDTLSLARMGAEVTGIDLSGKSIQTARSLSEELNIPATFIQSNVYDIEEHLEAPFDFIFTSYGAIPWLPDLKPWSELIGKFLKPDGYFFMAEFHPTFYLFDFDHLSISYPYFNPGKPFEEEVSGTYADPMAKLKHKEYFWCHALSEVLQPLLGQGLELKHFGEYPYSPYHVFPNMEEVEKGKYRLKLEVDIPHIFSLLMKKKKG
jgi:SAM-dependent methyltransferase